MSPLLLLFASVVAVSSSTQGGSSLHDSTTSTNNEEVGRGATTSAVRAGSRPTRHRGATSATGTEVVPPGTVEQLRAQFERGGAPRGEIGTQRRAQDEGRGAARRAGGSPHPAGGGGGHDPADGSGGHPAGGGGGHPGDRGGGTSGGGGDNISFLAGLPGDLVGGFLGSRSALEFRAAAKAFDTPLYEALLCELSSYNTSSGDLVRALRMLARTAEKGDSRVVAVVCRSCTQRRVIAAVSGRLLTDDGLGLAVRVRRKAVRVLEEIASKGSKEAIAAMLGRLIEDEDDDVRRWAVCGLTSIAEKGDAQVIAALRGQLVADGHFPEKMQFGHFHDRRTVRQEAVRALVTIAPNDVIGEVIAVISDQSRADGSVRAVSVLEQFAKELAAATPNVAFHKDNHKVVLQAICRVAADEQDPSIREAAVGALGQVAEKGDAGEQLIEVLRGRLAPLADGHFMLREEDVRVLANFAAISDLCQTDPDRSVRLVAASVLELFAPHKREVVLQAIIRVAADGHDPDVRRVAVRALAPFAISGNHEAIAAILRRLADEDPVVRSFAEYWSRAVSRILARIA